jgi:hypothetical protein
MASKKRRLHHYSVKLRKVSIKVLIFCLLLSALITAIALRSNNVRMLELREAVFVADREGEGVEVALNELRTFVHDHMNTDLNSGGVSIKPPIQLKHTYERLVSSQEVDIKEHNQKVIADAPGICERRFPAGQIRQRAACVDDYIATNTKKVNDKDIPKELYQFDFASPPWSPDTAGIMLLATIFLGALLTLRLLLGLFFSYELKN